MSLEHPFEEAHFFFHKGEVYELLYCMGPSLVLAYADDVPFKVIHYLHSLIR